MGTFWEKYVFLDVCHKMNSCGMSSVAKHLETIRDDIVHVVWHSDLMPYCSGAFKCLGCETASFPFANLLTQFKKKVRQKFKYKNPQSLHKNIKSKKFLKTEKLHKTLKKHFFIKTFTFYRASKHFLNEIKYIHLIKKKVKLMFNISSIPKIKKKIMNKIFCHPKCIIGLDLKICVFFLLSERHVEDTLKMLFILYNLYLQSINCMPPKLIRLFPENTM